MRRPQRLNTFVESAVIGQEIEIDCEEARSAKTCVIFMFDRPRSFRRGGARPSELGADQLDSL